MNELPDISFFDNDPQQIISDVQFTYERTVGKEVQKSSPEYLFISTMAAWVVLQRQQYEKSLKQELLYYATGDILDHLGANRNTPRTQSQGSTTTLEFELSSIQNTSIIIPSGTRVTADSVIFFATDEALIISAGITKGTVTATSVQTGAASNNIAVGEISIIVDPVAYVKTVSNTETTLGGRDTESDDSYRDRIYNAPSVFSIAGPRDAYIYLTKAADSSIGEVTVSSNMAGYVYVYPLLTNGEIPNQAILNKINDALSENTVRPIADNVHVLAPEIVNYDLNLTYYVDTNNAGNVDNISNAVNAAVDGWILWQRLKIGRDINTTELIMRIRMAGAKRVSINLPIDTVLSNSQLAVCGSRVVSFGGLEDE